MMTIYFKEKSKIATRCHKLKIAITVVLIVLKIKQNIILK
jgi:hypothetical protein